MAAMFTSRLARRCDVRAVSAFGPTAWSRQCVMRDQIDWLSLSTTAEVYAACVRFACPPSTNILRTTCTPTDLEKCPEEQDNRRRHAGRSAQKDDDIYHLYQVYLASKNFIHHLQRCSEWSSRISVDLLTTYRFIEKIYILLIS